ncbi:MAG: ABC transporter permease [Alphaproteobacteria bacterium]|nr:ABC transporter permease [Alphaproteobacteria bacterium]
MNFEHLKRPVQIGFINWRGMHTLYCKEVYRFMKVSMQTLAAPIVTSVLFMLVFSLALDGRASPFEGASYMQFLAPGLVMMAVLQNAFANTSSSIMIGKVQGNIVDILMPPMGSLELLVALSLGGITRGVLVGLISMTILSFVANLGLPQNILAASAFLLLGSCAMSLIGVLAGIWAAKYDSLAAITNFIIQPLSFLSGTFYSIERLPDMIERFANFNPFFLVIDGFRFGILGMNDGPILGGLIALFVLNVALFAISYYVLESGYKLKS